MLYVATYGRARICARKPRTHQPSGSYTHTHACTGARTPNFLKPTPTCLLRCKDLREFACQGGIVLDFIIQICYSNALGQFVAY